MSASSLFLVLLVVVCFAYSGQGIAVNQQDIADKYAEFSKTRYQNFNTCEGCIEVIDMVEEYGCGAACKVLPPPLEVLCDFIIGYVCQDIVKWITMGESSDKICTQIGFCSTKCVCGACTEFTEDRCLGLPAKCPVVPPAPSVAVDYKPTRNSDPRIQAMVMENVHRFKRSQLESQSFCLGSQCSNATLGCCLTCF